MKTDPSSLTHRSFQICVCLVLFALLASTQPAQASHSLPGLPVAAIRPGNAPKAAGDEIWDDQFLLGVYDSTSPGSTGVYAIAVGGTNVYVGGAFDRAGNVAANNIARWDTLTHQWSALGGGVDGWVHAITVDGEDVYVGGRFLHAGGITVTSLARWNETSQAWSAVGGALAIPSGTPDVYAIAAAANGDVYVGGSFATAGVITVNNIARWDGSSWHALGAGTGGTWPDVHAIAVTGSDVYIGGSFSTVNGNVIPGVAHWNGSVWSGLGSGVGGVYAEVDAVVTNGTNIYIGGRFAQVTDSTNGTQTAGHVAMWNGSVWSTMGGGVANPDVAALALGPAGIYVGGRFQTLANGTTSARGLARWDGSAWHSLGGGNGSITGNDGINGNLYALAFLDHQLFLGGFMTGSNDGRTLNYIGYWDVDNSDWYALGNSVNGPVYALDQQGENVFIGGSFTSAGGVKASSIVRWNQRTGEWTSLNGGISGCTGPFIAGCRPVVYAIAVDTEDVYVGGNFTSAGGVDANSIARWHFADKTWHALGGGVTCQGLGCSAYVRAINLSSYYDILVGGKFGYAGDPIKQVNNIATCNGSNWSALGNGTNGTVYDIAIYADPYTAYIVGSFTSPFSYVAMYDGANWNSLNADTISAPAYTIEADGLYLYVGGAFTNLGGPNGDYISSFDSNDWHQLYGDVLDNSVYALDYYWDSVYAGGDFTTAGILGVSRVAKNYADAWSGFGSGADDTVQAIMYSGKSLYIGGNFLNAGGKPSAYFGRWGRQYYGYLPTVVK